jgi:hypothetical protein
MNRREAMLGLSAATLLAATGSSAEAQAGAIGAGSNTEPVYELRVYHTYPGKLADVEARFRDHTMTTFKRHNVESVGYWTPLDEPLKGNALFCMLRHPSRQAAEANWGAIHDDPEWKQVGAASEAEGKLVMKVDSIFLKLTDFSPPAGNR